MQEKQQKKIARASEISVKLPQLAAKQTNDKSNKEEHIVENSTGKQWREKLFDAAKSDNLQRVKDIMMSLTQGSLSVGSVSLRDPATNMNALHVTLSNNSNQVSEYLLQTLDEETLTQDYKVNVKEIASNKTVLHMLTESGNLPFIKKLLGRITNKDKKKKYIEKTVLTELVGQRPRHLSSIHLAALYGHTNIVEYLINEEGVSVNTLNNKNDTPVLWAARGNHIETVRTLIRHGADLQHENDKGSTPLYWAVRYGFPQLLTVLITEGKANVNQIRKLGFVTPIVLAAALDYNDIVEILLQNGAKLNMKITGGMTALHHAAAEGNDQVIATLLRYGANVNETDNIANTPLLLAAKGKHLAAMHVLMQNGADIERKNKLGQNLWDFVVNADDKNFLENVLQLYINEKGITTAEKKIKFMGAKSPLHVAAAKEDVSTLNLLISLGVDCNSSDQNGNTFFHQAAQNNNMKVLKEMLEKVNVNAQNRDGDTALHMACKNGSLDAVTFLMPKSSLEKPNNSGETALHVAARSEFASPELVEKLVDFIVKASNWSLLDEKDKRGNTALHAAVMAERYKILSKLNYLNPQIANELGEFPLHIAATSGAPNLIEEILEVFGDPSKGLNIDERNSHGQSSLHICALRGDSARVELLMDHGADLMAADTEGFDEGDTVLHAIALKDGSDPTFATNGLVEVLDSIIFKAAKWWCIRNDRACPDVNSELYKEYTREAVIHLTTKVCNAQNLSVLCYAAQVGAIHFLNHLLNTDGVFRFAVNKYVKYDVSDLTPETLLEDDEDSVRKRTTKSHNQVIPNNIDGTKNPLLSNLSQNTIKTDDGKPVARLSLLDVIVNLEDEVMATRILNLMPLKKLVENYWSAYRWFYFIIMFAHIVYMALFSVYSLDSLQNFNVTRGSNGKEPEMLYVCFLILPAIIVLVQMYYIISNVIEVCKRKKKNSAYEGTDFDKLMHAIMLIIGGISPYLITILSFIFSGFVAIWYWSYMISSPNQPFYLAVALIFGWLFTIVYTKGFETMHSFSIMIIYIVIKDILRFLLLYLFVLLAFGLATHALFQIVPELSSTYPNAFSTLFVKFNVMLGLGGYIDNTFDQAYADVGSTSAPAKTVYIIYVIYANVILMSLLVAMMTDTYGEIKRKEGSTWRVGSVKQAMTIGWLLPCLKSCMATISFGRKRVWFDGQTLRFYTQIEYQTVIGNRDGEIDDLAESLQALDVKVNGLSKQVEHLITMYTQDFGTASTSLVKHPGIRRKATNWL